MGRRVLLFVSVLAIGIASGFLGIEDAEMSLVGPNLEVDGDATCVTYKYPQGQCVTSLNAYPNGGNPTGPLACDQDGLIGFSPCRDAAGASVDGLVVVTENLNRGAPGCDGISVFDVDTGAALVRGQRLVSPGRLAATQHIGTIIASNSNHPYGNAFLYLLRRDPSDSGRWLAARALEGADFTEKGGIAVMPDNETLLVAVGDNRGDRLGGEYSVAKYLVAEFAQSSVGPLRGAIRLQGAAARILPADDGRHAHIVAVGPDAASVHTIAVDSMAEAASPIAIQPPTVSGLRVVHAALSPDGRLLLVNGWKRGALAVADLSSRTAWDVSTGADIEVAGGVDIARAGPHQGLLALHALDSVVVFRIDSRARLSELARIRINPPDADETDTEMGPWPSIAWSRDSRHIIAASDDGEAEFVVVEVGDTGRSLNVARALTACPDGTIGKNAPQDILTGNTLPSAIVTSTPGPEPKPTTAPGDCVCAVVWRRVPPAVVAWALASPDLVSGWQQPRDPGKPMSPANPPRTCLSLRNANIAYHPVWNTVTWKADCP